MFFLTYLKRIVDLDFMKNLTGFIYHYNSLSLKLFPAGKHNEIDWNNIAFSDGNFDFYLLKDSEAGE